MDKSDKTDQMQAFLRAINADEDVSDAPKDIQELQQVLAAQSCGASVG